MLEQQALPGRVPPTSAGSYTTAQLNASFLRFLADQTPRPVVSQAREKKGDLAMFQTMIKTASLSLIVALAASNAPASDSATSAPRTRSGREIEQGWAEQIQRFEARVSARGLREADIPGAIISAPLPGFEASPANQATRQAEAVAPSQKRERPRRSGPKF